MDTSRWEWQRPTKKGTKFKDVDYFHYIDEGGRCLGLVSKTWCGEHAATVSLAPLAEEPHGEWKTIATDLPTEKEAQQAIEDYWSAA